MLGWSISVRLPGRPRGEMAQRVTQHMGDGWSAAPRESAGCGCEPASPSVSPQTPLATSRVLAVKQLPPPQRAWAQPVPGSVESPACGAHPHGHGGSSWWSGMGAVLSGVRQQWPTSLSGPVHRAARRPRGPQWRWQHSTVFPSSDACCTLHGLASHTYRCRHIAHGEGQCGCAR